MKSHSENSLRNIPVDQIDHNPDNPRLVFRPEELESLMNSIRQFEVQVPVVVFKRGKRFVLIDGERRWRCSIKLNKKTVPAIVQDEPSRLGNLLLMFNIHALREQWDLFTIANKLPDVLKLLKKELGKEPTDKELSAKTGLLVSQIRRCKILLDLPDQYKDTILRELHLPKSKQRLTEDMFIEMERAITRVERTMPDVVRKGKNPVRDVLIEKFKTEKIEAVTDFRLISKMASSVNLAKDKIGDAKKALKRLFEDNNYSIRDAFNDSVSDVFQEREVLSKINLLLDRFEEFDPDEIDDDVRAALKKLIHKANEILEH